MVTTITSLHFHRSSVPESMKMVLETTKPICLASWKMLYTSHIQLYWSEAHTANHCKLAQLMTFGELLKIWHVDRHNAQGAIFITFPSILNSVVQTLPEHTLHAYIKDTTSKVYNLSVNVFAMIHGSHLKGEIFKRDNSLNRLFNAIHTCLVRLEDISIVCQPQYGI